MMIQRSRPPVPVSSAVTTCSLSVATNPSHLPFQAWIRLSWAFNLRIWRPQAVGFRITKADSTPKRQMLLAFVPTKEERSPRRFIALRCRHPYFEIENYLFDDRKFDLCPSSGHSRGRNPTRLCELKDLRRPLGRRRAPANEY
jgi:hypothetical protein